MMHPHQSGVLGRAASTASTDTHPGGGWFDRRKEEGNERRNVEREMSGVYEDLRKAIGSPE